jgi:hypothetical protein
MSIQKNTSNFLRHHGLSFFTIINQTMELITDPATLGLYCYLSSKPQDWRICYKHLENRFNKGRDFILKRMDELKRLGLIKKKSIRDEKGQIMYWETILVNFVQSHNTQNSTPGLSEHETDPDAQDDPNDYRASIHNTENPECRESTRLEKQALIIKEKTHIKENTKNICATDVARTHFDDFWFVYPVKKNKARAKEVWLKNKHDRNAEEIIKDVKNRLLNDTAWKDPKYICHPSKYLKYKRWEDEINLHLVPSKKISNFELALNMIKNQRDVL